MPAETGFNWSGAILESHVRSNSRGKLGIITVILGAAVSGCVFIVLTALS
jgi:hypothetical protein